MRRRPLSNGHRLLPAELGNAWANENTFTAAEGIIWFRYHNYVASELHREHPGWSDEELFQNARKAVVATFQVGGGVCVVPSLPRCWVLISTLERMRGQKDSVDPISCNKLVVSV